MLPLPPFQLHRPESIAEASRLRAEHREARFIAGGTDLLPSMKQGLFEPPHLISLQSIAELRQSGPWEGGVALGAGLSLVEVAQQVARSHPALAAACRTVATPTLQRMATLGGNLLLDTRCLWYNQSAFWREAKGPCLKCDKEGICYVAPRGTGCYAAHSADTVPVLMLYEARVELASPRGVREVPVRELYANEGRQWLRLQPGEILTRVLLPPARQAVVHRKTRARGAIDYPLLLTALRQDGAAVLSAIGPRPLQLSLSTDPETAAQQAHKKAFPLQTHAWSSTWRKHMVRVEVLRAWDDLAAL